MELTAIAQWLNTAFAGYDYAILQALHNLDEAAGGFFTPLCRAITLLGEKGILFLVLGIVLMLFPKTHKAGICMFGAVCCGALLFHVSRFQLPFPYYIFFSHMRFIINKCDLYCK